MLELINEWYVSVDGDDRWSGRSSEPNSDRSDGPFASIARAQAEIRDRKHKALLADHSTIWIRGGRYHLNKPLQFTPEDSAAVTYAAYPGEQPIIDGGRLLSGWREEQHNGITMWVTDVPDVAAGRWYFRQLFVNGQRKARTRLPKQGYYWMQDVPGTHFHNKGLTNDLFEGSDTFICAPGDIQPWRNLQDVDIVALHFWIEERMPIASLDAETGTVRSNRRSIFVLKDDVAKRYAKYYVENVFEALEEPGQWYVDRQTGRVYYIPMPGDRMEETEVYAGEALQLLQLSGNPDKLSYVEHIRFKELTFTHTDWQQPPGGGERFERPGIDFAAAPQSAFQIPGVICLKGARYCAIEDCRIEHIGWYGIELSDGCTSNRIVGNTIADAGAGGIKLDGADAVGSPFRRTGSNRITDNHLHHGGRVFHSGVGILSVHASDNVIAHNHIHDFYYTGISCGWVWGYADSASYNNRIEHNWIHDLGDGLLSDMGGIYTLGVQPGTVIRGNLIHDIEKCNYGGWAIYPDEGSSHILIENNVCYNTSSQVFHQHYGRENIVRNNIFAFGREGQASLSRAEEHLSFTFENNIILSNDQPLFVTGYGAAIDGLPFRSNLNLFWDIGGHSLLSGKQHFDEAANFSLMEPVSIEKLRQLGYDQHSIIADPLFRDPVNGDFTLSEDSPAYSLGFRKFDLSNVGPRSADVRN